MYIYIYTDEASLARGSEGPGVGGEAVLVTGVMDPPSPRGAPAPQTATGVPAPHTPPQDATGPPAPKTPPQEPCVVVPRTPTPDTPPQRAPQAVSKASAACGAVVCPKAGGAAVFTLRFALFNLCFFIFYYCKCKNIQKNK